MKKLLVITNLKGMGKFALPLGENLKKQTNVEITYLDYGDWKLVSENKIHSEILPAFLRGNNIKYHSKIFNRVIYALRKAYYFRILKKISDEFDLIHIIYLSSFLYENHKYFKRINKRIIVSFMGSDFYEIRTNPGKKVLKFLKNTERITFNNPQTRDEFLEIFGNVYNNKTVITGFGLDILNNIKKLKSAGSKEFIKRKLGIKSDDIVITCGYNGNPRQQHNIILKSLIKIKSQLPSNITIILPLTYGLNGWGYYNELKDLLETTGFNYQLIGDPGMTPFSLSDDQVAEIRLISDIVINIQLTDQASASLLEHLYAGSIIIVGDWLPYVFWNDTGQYYIKTSVAELPDKLLSGVDNIDKNMREVSKNSEKILTSYGWNNMIDKWLKILCSETPV